MQHGISSRLSVNQIVDGSMKVERDLIAMVNRRIAEIDRLVSLLARRHLAQS